MAERCCGFQRNQEAPASCVPGAAAGPRPPLTPRAFLCPSQAAEHLRTSSRRILAAPDPRLPSSKPGPPPGGPSRPHRSRSRSAARPGRRHTACDLRATPFRRCHAVWPWSAGSPAQRGRSLPEGARCRGPQHPEKPPGSRGKGERKQAGTRGPLTQGRVLETEGEMFPINSAARFQGSGFMLNEEYPKKLKPGSLAP